MKFTSIVSLVPVLAYMATTVAAYPVNGYQPNALVERDGFLAVDGHFVLRSEEDLYVRGIWDKLRFRKKVLTEEQKQAKIRKLNQKLYKTIGDHHHKVAKVENGGHTGKVNVHSYTGNQQHKAMAEGKAQKEWKSNKNLQQFKHVDLNVKEEPGKKHVTARYHNGPGNGFGSTTHFFHHDK